MSNSSAELPTREFTLRPPPPVRALAIAGAAAVLGAVLVVGGSAVGLPLLLTVVGTALIVLAVALAATALVLTRRLGTALLLDAEAITATRRARTTSMRWSEVDEVRLEGPHLVLVAKAGAADLEILNPRTSGDPHFAALLTALQHYLDRSRGYTPFS